MIREPGNAQMMVYAVEAVGAAQQRAGCVGGRAWFA